MTTDAMASLLVFEKKAEQFRKIDRAETNKAERAAKTSPRQAEAHLRVAAAARRTANLIENQGRQVGREVWVILN